MIIPDIWIIEFIIYALIIEILCFSNMQWGNHMHFTARKSCECRFRYIFTPIFTHVGAILIKARVIKLKLPWHFSPYVFLLFFLK